MNFNKVAVIGAGTMGAGIAGQVANAGVDVLLLDLKEHQGDPNARARAGLDRLNNPAAPGLMDEQAGARIQLGNIEDDFQRLRDCDWVAEAVVERLDIKRELYRRLDQTCDAKTIVTSNTSTIPIRLLMEDMPESFASRFAITHFFNPVRYMRLLELVRGERTADEVMDKLEAFCDRRLGKGVVRCADTPGFLGNRVGVFAIQCALHAALDLGLKPTEADAIFGRPMGIPKTGVFGLYDLIGIDLMADVVDSLKGILPKDDAFHGESATVPLMQEMIGKGWTGNKGGQGFYRTDPDGGGRLMLDLETGDYVARRKPALPACVAHDHEGLVQLLGDDSIHGRFAWRVLSRTLSYAASLMPEVGDDPVPVDDAMKLGYNWLEGPFEMIDRIGPEFLVRGLESEHREVPEYLRSLVPCYRVDDGRLQSRRFGDRWTDLVRPQGIVRFNETKRTLKAVNANAAASWYERDDAALVEFHSKANVLDGQSMSILADAVSETKARGLKGLVVHNDAAHFSCGVDLGRVRAYVEREDYEGLDKFLNGFQEAVMAMRDAAFPVVVAPAGLSIGGGFEVVLHAQHVICHANSVMGLVESLVGLVPAGGGCKETLYRWVAELNCDTDITVASWKAFKQIGYGVTASSPALARQQAMIRAGDGFEMNRDRLYSAAINALGHAQMEKASRPVLSMPGSDVFHEMIQWLRDARDQGKLTSHDVVVGGEIARIVTGGDIEPGTANSEQDLLDAERRAFLALAGTAATRERIDHMLEFGKPLRN